MTLKMKKNEFRCNKENKQQFIHLLTDKLQQSGCECIRHVEMQMSPIVKTVVVCAGKQDTVVNGDDTGLLVLLCFHAEDTQYNVFFRPEPKKHSQRPSRCWNIKQPAHGLVTISVTIFFSSMLSWGVTPLQGFLTSANHSH
jgi:hypothetical protein